MEGPPGENVTCCLSPTRAPHTHTPHPLPFPSRAGRGTDSVAITRFDDPMVTSKGRLSLAGKPSHDAHVTDKRGNKVLGVAITSVTGKQVLISLSSSRRASAPRGPINFRPRPAPPTPPTSLQVQYHSFLVAASVAPTSPHL